MNDDTIMKKAIYKFSSKFDRFRLESLLYKLTSATFGMSKAAGSPRNFDGQSAPVPMAEPIACLLSSSALRVPRSRISVDTVVGPNMFEKK